MPHLIPGLKLELAKINGDAKILANPNVRVMPDVTGFIKIGERVSIVNSVIDPDLADIKADIRRVIRIRTLD